MMINPTLSVLCIAALLFTSLLQVMAAPDFSSQELVGWFEPQNFDTQPSFNLRVSPVIVDVDAGTRISIRLPENTKLTVDYPELTCGLRSNANLRYTYWGLQVQADAKRKRQTVHSIAFSLPSRWFEVDAHNIWVQCFGLEITTEAYNDQLMNTPTSPQFYTWIDTTKRPYTLIDAQDSIDKTTGRKF